MKTLLLLTTLAVALIVPTALADDATSTTYDVQVRQNDAAPWQDQGTWVIGGRADERPIELKLGSRNDGQDVMGQVKYRQQEGMLGLHLRRADGRHYSSATKKGNADDLAEGEWVIGQDDQSVSQLVATSADGGKTLTGTIIYDGGEKLDFKATHTGADVAKKARDGVDVAHAEKADKASFDGRYVNGETVIVVSGQGSKLALTGNGTTVDGKITAKPDSRFEGALGDAGSEVPISGSYTGNTLTLTVIDGEPIQYTKMAAKDADNVTQGDDADDAPQANKANFDGRYVNGETVIVVSGQGSKLALTGNGSTVTAKITGLPGSRFEGTFSNDGNDVPISGRYTGNTLTLVVINGEPIVYNAAPADDAENIADGAKADNADNADKASFDGRYVNGDTVIVVSGQGSKLALTGNGTTVDGKITPKPDSRFEGALGDAGSEVPISGSYTADTLTLTVINGEPIEFKAVPADE